MANAARAQTPVRRRHRRRRLARARDRLLPREATTAIRDVAILEQSYIGSGASGRNTTIIRSNYRTPEGAAFYGESVQLYEGLSDELDFNLMFSQHGHLTLAHSDRAMIAMQERAEVNQLLGIDSSVDLPATRSRELCPRARPLAAPDLADRRRALPPARRDHPPRRRRLGLRARRRPRAASRSTRTPRSPGIERERRRVTAVETNRGRVEAAGRRQRDRRLVDARLRARRRPAPDHDAHPAGVRDRAGEAVPRRRHRLVADARLRLADRPRRVPDRRRDRAVHDVQEHGHAVRSSSTRRAHALELFPQLERLEGAAHVDGPLRPLARTTARSSARPRSTTSTSRRRLGDVRLQGRADRRRDARRARRDREARPT